MTEYQDQQPEPGSYGGPPPTQQYGGQYGGQPAQPQYPYQQYPPQQYPPAGYGQQPAYGYPPGQYPGQPYGYGYPPPPYGPPPQLGPKRPGLVVAAAVLAYVNAGMIILAGALLLFGAAIVDDLEDVYGSDTNYSTEVAVAGVVNFVAAGLLIAGAVAFTGAKASGRLMLSVGNGLVLALAIYWLIRFSDDRFDSIGDGYVVWAVIFSALAILPLAFSFTGPINRWLGEQDVRRA